MEFDVNSINSARTYYDLLQEHAQRESDLFALRNRMSELSFNHPVATSIQALTEKLQEQNKILLNQLKISEEENERQKKQLKEAIAAEKKARRKAILVEIASIIAFVITTTISIIALFK